MDLIDGGDISKSTPLQAAVLAHSVSHQPRHLTVLDDNIREICSHHAQPKQQNQQQKDDIDNDEDGGCSLDVDVVLDEVLHSLNEHNSNNNGPLFPPPSPSTSSTFLRTTNDVFQFIDDMNIVLEQSTDIDHIDGDVNNVKKRVKVSDTSVVNVACQTLNLPTPPTKATSPSPNVSRIVPFKPPSSATRTDKKNHKNHDNNNDDDVVVEDKSLNSTTRRNPFCSAKDQFISDGGQFKQNQQTRSNQTVSQLVWNVSIFII